VIELRDISVRFRADGRDVEAVRKVSLHVEDGEVFGIVGSSGAGKSTLVRTINLLERPSEGTVHVGGADVTRHRGEALRAMRRGIGMVFQHFNLLHARTVFDNVAFPLVVAGQPREAIARRVPELLGLVGLEDKARAYPAQLSGGQKQRVGIARALATQPRILLCDEPTSALDLETTGATLALLDDLHRRLGFTMVVITHEMEVVKALCDRVAVMARGEIVEQGTVYDVFASPRHELTRQLVARTQGLSLPPRLLDGSRGRVVKVLFRGATAEEPIVSEASRRFDVKVNILHGRIEYIGGHPIGVLVVGLEGPAASVAQALAFMRASTAGVEELHG
jgi:D-methionine transport system ATP-binding protein